ncbi:response regulator [Flavihumibacter solisilvae]|uniref:response regulator n=1 Tax=Flavihumibacter solisilvae TaxID=1349421 RepID=UPI000689C00E|nr:response regulator [Flavihumibacter solisilvae]
MKTSFKILYIEDDQDDIELLQDALKEQEVTCQMDVITDGQHAVEHLSKINTHPDIIILDLNLPKVHGRDVLKYIKNNEAIQHLPVLILTTSNHLSDITEAYKNGAVKYLPKPSSVTAIRNTVETIIHLVNSATAVS